MEKYPKKRLAPLILFFLVALMVNGCGYQVESVPVETTPKPQPVTTPLAHVPESDVASTPSALLEGEQTPEQPDHKVIPRYELAVVYDHQMKSVSVKQKIHYQNNTGAELTELQLVVEPNRYPDVFTLTQASTSEGSKILSIEIDDHIMRVIFEDVVEPGDWLTLDFDFDLKLPAIPPPDENFKAQIFGFTSRQTNLVDWYPFIPPYDPGSGWVIHPPSFFGEFLVYPLAEFLVTLSIESPFQDVVVAASTIAEQQDGKYYYHLIEGRNFVFSFSPDFIEKTMETDGLLIKGYWFPFEARAGEQALQDTLEAAKLYSELFGPLARKSISLVQADFLDGMEFDGLFFLSKGFYNTYDGTPKGYLTAIAVHETAHMWFYGLVANDQAMEPWLDEALCTYSELLFYERYYPELVDWWWYFRVNFYEPVGVIDLPVYDYRGFLPYRNAVYLRGALFLQEIRDVIGDEAFFAALKSYAQSGAGSIQRAGDFFAAIAENSREDITPVREKYFSPRTDPGS